MILQQAAGVRPGDIITAVGEKDTTLLISSEHEVRYCCSIIEPVCWATVHRVGEIGTLKLRC